MRKFRKGFTLIELLIVIAILGALSATMAISAKGTAAKAKANAILSNISVCRSAAVLYYADHNGEDISSIKTEDALKEYISMLEDFKRTTDSITYSFAGTGPSNWKITVDFSVDSESTAIAGALGKVKGYSGVKDRTSFNVILLTGEVNFSSIDPDKDPDF